MRNSKSFFGISLAVLFVLSLGTFSACSAGTEDDDVIDNRGGG